VVKVLKPSISADKGLLLIHTVQTHVDKSLCDNNMDTLEDEHVDLTKRQQINNG